MTKYVIQDMVFSPNGKQLVSTSSSIGGGQLILWDVVTGAPIGEPEYNGMIASVEFSPDGKTFISSSASNGVQLWDADPRKLGKSLLHRQP